VVRDETAFDDNKMASELECPEAIFTLLFYRLQATGFQGLVPSHGAAREETPNANCKNF
jgi:hypothetical protein